MSDQRYLVTARKYRPNLFHELVAQEHVTETLKNALRLDRLAHAYLFSGPRGIGKTTAARILAKAINCTTPPEERTDAAEPCRQCESCRDFETGRSLSIFEIDAASNNKVEDIRDLRETVRIPPQGSRKKVYIIDEVHMLSNAAFNALLKTLEEPPPHVLFIFATTEPHKVLPTILSRCQRFDFRRIPVPEIVARLRLICEEETITADEASLLLLARKGDGALRDSFSAFDQAVSLCGTDLHYTDLAEALRVVDVDLFFDVTRHVSERSSSGMLRLVDHIVQSGYDLQEFLVGLAEHLRNLLVALTMQDTALIEAAEATRQRYAEISRAFTETDLLRLLMVVDETEESIKSSAHPRMKLEMALLKMAALSRSTDLREALQHLDRLETLAREGTLSPGSTPPPLETSDPKAPPVHVLPIPPPPPDVASVEDVETPSEETGQPPAPVEDTSEHTDAPAPEPEEDTPPPAPDYREQPSPPPRPPDYPSLFGPPALQKKAPRTAAPDAETDATALFEGSGALKTLQKIAVAPPAPTLLESVWPRYIQAVKTERIHVGALLQHAAPLEVEAETVVIGVPDDFHRRLLNNQHDFLLKHLNGVHPEDVSRITFTICEDIQPSVPEQTTPDIDPYEYMQRKRQENPVIQAIFDQFGGELVW
ncbi:MAG: DNA polymerase III subunit gamma/tau [Rhodothermales bacterium]